MAKTSGYWIELSGVKFDEVGGDISSWIQAVPQGTYDHPIYGEMVFDAATIKDFETNINNNVRTAKLDIDYDHKAKNGEAAGWVNKAEARSDGLWILVDWTKDAAQKIKDKAYRYFSPEIVDEWTDPKSGTTFKNLIFGGGITNRPFLRDILPINLSEMFVDASNQPTKQEGKSMNKEQRKTLAEKLGLAEDVADDVFYKKLEETLDAAPGEKEGDKEGEEEVDEELKQLSETNPVVAKLMETMSKQLADVNKQLREKDVEATVAKLSETFTKKGIAIAPAALTSLTKSLSDAPTALRESIVATFTSIADAGVVALGEKGHSREQKDGTSPAERFNVAAKKLMEDNKLNFAQAAEQVAKDDPELFAEYQVASYAGNQ